MLTVIFLFMFLLSAFTGHTDEAVNILKWGAIFVVGALVLRKIGYAVDEHQARKRGQDVDRASSDEEDRDWWMWM